MSVKNSHQIPTQSTMSGRQKLLLIVLPTFSLPVASSSRILMRGCRCRAGRCADRLADRRADRRARRRKGWSPGHWVLCKKIYPNIAAARTCARRIAQSVARGRGGQKMQRLAPSVLLGLPWGTKRAPSARAAKSKDHDAIVGGIRESLKKARGGLISKWLTQETKCDRDSQPETHPNHERVCCAHEAARSQPERMLQQVEKVLYR